MSHPDPALDTLLDVFHSLPCSRKARGKRFELGPTLALSLIAVLSGCKNRSQIADFGKNRPKLLEKLGFAPPRYPRKKDSRGKIRAPKRDTVRRLLNSVSADELNHALAGFFARMLRRGDRAAVDGKALRGADDFVLSIFVNDICQVVWQEDVGKKENELSCLERSLGAVLECYPNLRLLTGDAAFCHKTIARELIQARRDYLFQLKAPHTTDLRQAEEAFRQLRHTEPLAQSVEKRGAQEGRKS